MVLGYGLTRMAYNGGGGGGGGVCVLVCLSGTAEGRGGTRVTCLLIEL
jgi:hypothetical protein